MKEKMFEDYPDILTIDDLTKMLNIGRNKAYQLIKEGKIRTVRIGRKHRIVKKILIEYLENS